MKTSTNLLFLIISSNLFATNYFVKPSGNDSNNGLTTLTAFQSLNFAAEQTAPGDTVFIMNGTYYNVYPESNVLDVTISGTQMNPIVFMNFENHTPVIKLNGNNWGGVSVDGADYISIIGLKIVGNNDSITLPFAQSQSNNLSNPATSGNGIGISQQYSDSTNKPHHVVIKNCTVSNCGGGGIYTYWADYITIENNVVYNCAWYSPYGNSGISLYQNWNSDSSTALKNYVIGNTSYRNQMFIPWFVTNSITDGNGIIIDDFRNTQNASPNGIYLGKTYVANNLVYDNGGRGIHCYSTNNVIFVNNTCYKNCQSPFILDGEFTAYDADNVVVVNNISQPDGNIPPINLNTNTVTNILVENNLWANNSTLAIPFGAITFTGATDFVSPSSNPTLADFQLLNTSSAVNNGAYNFAPLYDKIGVSRTSNGNVDIGCYEFNSSLALKNIKKNNVEIYPNPTEGIITIIPSFLNKNNVNINIYDAFGRIVKTLSIPEIDSKIDINLIEITKGIYTVEITNGEEKITKQVVIK
jgi:parallel beta-helix repeat protein